MLLRRFVPPVLVVGALAVPSGTRAAPPSSDTSAQKPRVRYDGHSLVRALPRSHAELAEVLAIADDVWTEHPGLGPIDVRVSPQSLTQLDATGIDYEMRIRDLQVAVDDEHTRLTTLAIPNGTAAAPGAWFSDFKNVDEVDAYLDTLATDVPDIVTVEDVGTSLDGRPIRALKLTSGDASGKAAVIFTGTQHAREWLSPMTVMCIADTVARDYDTDPRITEVLDALELYVIPVVNPDGYAYSWSTDRYWRKNTRGGYGVDLNRNWDHQFGGEGSSGNQGSEIYRGDSAFSEPESQAVADYYAARPNAVGSIDFHSYAELILYPWGYQYGPAPDAVELSALASEMSEGIASVHGRNFDAIQGAELYPASGVIDDWAYAEHGLMAFTIELRGNDFVTAPSNIIPSCEENLEAAMTLMEWALQFSDVSASDGDTEGSGGTGTDGLGDGGSAGNGSTTDAGADGGADAIPGTGATAEGGAGADDATAGGAATNASADTSGAGTADDGDNLPSAFGERIEAQGCGCRHDPRAPFPAGWSLLAVIAIARRRRR